jgi:glycosidase
LKARPPALANGAAGGAVELLEAGSPDLFAFRRSTGRRYVSVAVNLSAAPVTVPKLPGIKAQTLPAWGYVIGAR